MITRMEAIITHFPETSDWVLACFGIITYNNVESRLRLTAAAPFGRSPLFVRVFLRPCRHEFHPFLY